MKRLISKTVLVIVLTVALCAASVSTPTFSWYTRPASADGGAIVLGGTAGVTYNISTGEGVTMTTVAGVHDSQTNTVTYGDTATDLTGSQTLAKGETRYYCTTITNSSTADQNVSLYLSNVDLGTKLSGNFCVGVNGPMRTYKSYAKVTNEGSKGSEITREFMRIYFRPHTASGSSDVNWSGKSYNLVYGVGKEPDTYVAMTATTTTDVYYADIPSDATQVFVAVKDYSESWQRTQTFTDIKGDGLSTTQSLLLYLNGSYDSTAYNNAQASKEKVVGANIYKYYDTITVPVGQTYSAALSSSNYSGSTIRYYDDDSYLDIFTAVETTGVITAKAVGTSYLYTKVTGAFGDTLEVKTTVKVIASFSDASKLDVPVITNCKIDKSTSQASDVNVEGEPVETVILNGVETVYWYIKNDSTTSLTYSLDGIYLSL